jgi:hypothetical protein
MIKATDKSEQDDIVAADTHNRLAKQIVAQIVNEPIAAGGTFSDFMVLCESMLVGVMIGCFQLGSFAERQKRFHPDHQAVSCIERMK